MPWYVIHSKPNKEELLYEQLCLRKVDAYYPSIKVRPVKPRARKRKPYFPGYLFVNTDLEALKTSTLRWMPGAIGLIDFGGEPACIPEKLIQTIRHNVERANNVAEKKHTNFKSGDIVTIQSGPFAGYRAIFDTRIPGRERVRVFMQMLMDRQLGVELSEGQIKHTKNNNPRK